MSPSDRDDLVWAPTSLPNEGAEVAIVIVNFNGTADTLKCLESIRLLTHPKILTIVVDNGSQPDESDLIAGANPWAVTIRREVNGGWAGGNNEGIAYALGNGVGWILLLNNDTIVSPDLIDRLLAASRAEPRFGVLGPIICYMDEPERVMTDGCDFNPPGFPGFFRRHPIPIVSADPPDVTEVDIVNGCCLMIAAEVIRRVGSIDERFFLIHEESDLCLRARQAGFACGLIAEPLVWHKGSSSFERAGNGLQRYYDARNLCLLLRKHRSSHFRARGALASWFAYFRYVYHRYAIEREHGQDEAADAVLRGLCDALAGRFGPRGPGRPPALVVARQFFELSRRVWHGSGRG